MSCYAEYEDTSRSERMERSLDRAMDNGAGELIALRDLIVHMTSPPNNGTVDDVEYLISDTLDADDDDACKEMLLQREYDTADAALAALVKYSEARTRVAARMAALLQVSA